MTYQDIEITLSINQCVRVGPALIELFSTDHAHAKLGIAAPRAVPILRGELLPKKEEPK